jgi:pimeloyl-ACP methyl ester carboxylesterase
MAEPAVEGDELFLLAESSISFTWQGRRLHASVRRGGTGQPLLALAGFLAGGATFSPLVGQLRRRFELIIPELDFSGAADLITDSGRLADLLGALAGELVSGSARWLAQGEFALAALQLGLERPGLMEALVLLAPPLELTYRFRARHLGLLFAAGRRAWARQASLEPYRTARQLFGEVDPLLLHRTLIRRQARRLDNEPAAQAAAQLVGNSLKPSFRRQILQLVSRRAEQPQPFPAPLYILFGESDRHSSRRCRSLLARSFPGSQVATLPDAGWIPHLEQPQAVVDALFSVS